MHLLALLIPILKDFLFFTTYVKNNVFPRPLDKDDEKKYIELLMDGDPEARRILIEHNLRLVAHIVKKYDNTKEDVEDLISIGIVGLIKGVDTYSNKKGTQLTTYCARCIENEILMHLRTLKKTNKNVSLYEPIGYDKEGNEITLIDVIKEEEIDYVDKIHIKNNIDLLKQYLDILSEREKDIIVFRYGLYLNPILTQKEIAKKYNISRSYVSRIEKRALSKILREFIKNKKHPF